MLGKNGTGANPAQNDSVWGSCYRDQLLAFFLRIAEHVSLQRIISAAISTFDADRLIVFLQNLKLAVGIQVCSEM
jgi:hypothetical protein